MTKAERILYGTAKSSLNINIKKDKMAKIHDRVFLILTIKYEDSMKDQARRIMAIPDKKFNAWNLSTFKGVFGVLCKQ